MSKEIELIKSSIRDIPDFPKKGVIFKDITTALKDKKIMQLIIEKMSEPFKGKDIDYIVGIESRGFIFGMAMAHLLDVGFIPIRKPGKLPYKTKSIKYTLEYGEDTLEIHEDAIEAGKNVVIVDDLLATGGTAAAAIELVNSLGANIECFSCLIELEFLKGREKLSSCKVMSLINY